MLSEWTPKRAQTNFLYHTTKNDWARYVWYVGGFGSGKSLVLCKAVLQLARDYPGNRILLARSTYEDLKNTTMKTFFDDAVPRDLILDYNKVDKRVLIETDGEPSEVLFSGLDDIERLKSLEIGAFAIDEVNEVSEDTFLILTGRLRRKQAGRRVGLIASNSEGKNWTWRKFVYEPKPGYVFIKATTFENASNLPDDYIDRMLADYPEDMIRRYVYADFNVFSGQIYPEFNRDMHVYNDRPLPDEWEFAGALDPGGSNPNAWLFLYIDYDGNIFLQKEKYDTNKIVSDHVYDIQQILTGNEWNRFKNIFPVADTNVNTKNVITGKTIADEYLEQGKNAFNNERGIVFHLANKDVLGGINRVREYLRFDPKHKHPLTGQMGAPRLFINEKCENTIREMETYQWAPQSSRDKELNMPERPLKKFDHAMDALRYFIMSRPRRPKHVIPEIKRAITMEDKVRVMEQERLKVKPQVKTPLQFV